MSLEDDTSLVIKTAGNGSTVVVRLCSCYILEAEKQLGDIMCLWRRGL